MNDPLNWKYPIVPGDIIVPTPSEIERNLTGAGTYLLAIDAHEIKQLRAGKVLCFYLEDMQNILLRLRGDDEPDSPLTLERQRLVQAMNPTVSTEGASWAMEAQP